MQIKDQPRSDEIQNQKKNKPKKSVFAPSSCTVTALCPLCHGNPSRHAARRAPQERLWVSPIPTPPACPAWRNAGGGPPALNYSVTNILCTFPHQPTCHLPRPDRDAALPIHYPSISTIHTKQYLDQSTLLISKLGCLPCVIQLLPFKARIKEGSKNFFTESVRKRKSPQSANFPPGNSSPLIRNPKNGGRHPICKLVWD